MRCAGCDRVCALDRRWLDGTDLELSPCMKKNGFSYVELLVCMFLLLTAMLFVGRMMMTSMHLIGKGKLNQRATLLLLEKIEQLRAADLLDLASGDFEEATGV